MSPNCLEGARRLCIPWHLQNSLTVLFFSVSLIYRRKTFAFFQVHTGRQSRAIAAWNKFNISLQQMNYELRVIYSWVWIENKDRITTGGCSWKFGVSKINEKVDAVHKTNVCGILSSSHIIRNRSNQNGCRYWHCDSSGRKKNSQAC